MSPQAAWWNSGVRWRHLSSSASLWTLRCGCARRRPGPAAGCRPRTSRPPRASRGLLRAASSTLVRPVTPMSSASPSDTWRPICRCHIRLLTFFLATSPSLSCVTAVLISGDMLATPSTKCNVSKEDLPRKVAPRERERGWLSLWWCSCKHHYYTMTHYDYYTLVLCKARWMCRQGACKRCHKSYPLMGSLDPCKTQSTVGTLQHEYAGGQMLQGRSQG